MKCRKLLLPGAAVALLVAPASADSLDVNFAGSVHQPPSWAGGGGSGDDGGDDGGGESSASAPSYFGWMSPGIVDAWSWDSATGSGNLGQGVSITVVDDFSSKSKSFGDLGDGRQRLRHGEWTLKQAGMIAPSANMIADDFYDGGAISLAQGAFNVLSLSYGYTAPLDRDLEISIVNAAETDGALIAKSAGNENGLPLGQRGDGGFDYLSLELVASLDGVGDTESATAYDSTIFVGALDWNVIGTGDSPSAIAAYSSIAGDDPDVQRQFLVVGVEAASGGPSFGTGLAGTSFAAPVVAGYGAVISSKFPEAMPSEVAERLLETAVQDTIIDYNPRIHGQGEADVEFAISPDFVY